MKRFLLLLLLFVPLRGWCGYTADVLGSNYECRRLTLPSDGADVPPVCHLVRHRGSLPGRTTVLYLHGYNDYFFQKALGDSVVAHGYAFYALDLRDYGRSIVAGREPFYTTDLRVYHADVDAALAALRAEGCGPVVLLAHSTGGLIAADYLTARGSGAAVAGAALNSPFLDWNLSRTNEKWLLPAVSAVAGRLFPRTIVQRGDTAVDHYAASLLAGMHGEWTYNTDWKRSTGTVKRAGWIRAIRKAQRRVRRGRKGGGVERPVLVMASDSTLGDVPAWIERFKHADIVLDVNDIRRYGARLGNDVEQVTVAGGMHDLFLSPRPARNRAYAFFFEWLERRFAPGGNSRLPARNG